MLVLQTEYECPDPNDRAAVATVVARIGDIVHDSFVRATTVMEVMQPDGSYRLLMVTSHKTDGGVDPTSTEMAAILHEAAEWVAARPCLPLRITG